MLLYQEHQYCVLRVPKLQMRPHRGYPNCLCLICPTGPISQIHQDVCTGWSWRNVKPWFKDQIYDIFQKLNSNTQVVLLSSYNAFWCAWGDQKVHEGTPIQFMSRGRSWPWRVSANSSTWNERSGSWTHYVTCMKPWPSPQAVILPQYPEEGGLAHREDTYSRFHCLRHAWIWIGWVVITRGVSFWL